jgi:hypothetical protein
MAAEIRTVDVPDELIGKIVRYRVEQNEQAAR